MLTEMLRCERLVPELAARGAVRYRHSKRVDASMTDVIVKLPVHKGEESDLFGSVLSAFIERLSPRAELWAANSDAPYLMVRSDPQPDFDLKVLTFQDRRAAADFSRRWTEAVAGLTAKVTYLMG